MRVMIVGSKGQLGQALRLSVPADTVLVGADLPRIAGDDYRSLLSYFDRYKPSHVINAAAYTDVELAETEPGKALRINSDLPRVLASICKSRGLRFIHISSDYVFNGMLPRPYQPDDVLTPLSVYGKTKAAGDISVLSVYPANSVVLRTGWLYSNSGKNFVKTILNRLQTKQSLIVVADQIGSPTWTNSLAHCIWKFVDRTEIGVWNFTDAGTASWYDFAMAIAEESTNLGYLDSPYSIEPIRTEDFATNAKRPHYVILDKTATWRISGQPNHWRCNLRKVLMELNAAKVSQF